MEINRRVKEHMDTIQKTDFAILLNMADRLVRALNDEKKIIIFGNGGSAADAQHFAAELVGKYKKNRKALPAIAVTTNSSTITAIGNDYGYEETFKRSVEALAEKGDVLIGISTSGRSKNVIKALTKGKEIGCITLGFTGKQTTEMDKWCDLAFKVSSENTPIIQEVHITALHILCELIEDQI